MKRFSMIVWLVPITLFVISCQTTMPKIDHGNQTLLPAEPPTVQCKTLKPPPQGTCTVTMGTGAMLIQGNILDSKIVYQGGDVLITQDGRIDCVDCDCSGRQAAAGATIVTCAKGVVSPGLINAHDHLNYNQSYPGDWGNERYDQRNDWRKGLRGHTKINYTGDNRPLALAWNELRQVIAGTTSVAGSGGVKGFMRNLDKTDLQEGLKLVKVYYNVFPLGDSDGTQLEKGCNYPKIDPPNVITDNDCYLPHVAEGVDQVAHNEFLCLSGQQSGGEKLISPKSAFVHTISLLAPDGKLVNDSKTSVVWSPRSNIALYGNTATITMYDVLGVNIAISTDWMPSGSMSLLRELKCVNYFNSKHLNNYFNDRKIWKMVTQNAAHALAVDDQVGSLSPGLYADIAIYDGSAAPNYYRAVTNAEVKDTVLVLRAGLPLYGDTDVMAVIPNGQSGCEELPGGVCSVNKSFCIKRESGVDFAALAQANPSSYPLFFCGTPDKEPTCVPSRPADQYGCGQYPLTDPSKDLDGDGVEDSKDNCPTIFNPVRPVDDYSTHECKQADYNGNGVGDACDPNPLSVGVHL